VGGAFTQHVSHCGKTGRHTNTAQIYLLTAVFRKLRLCTLISLLSCHLCSTYVYAIFGDKTKTMVFRDKQISSKICIDRIELENVKKFTNLESNMTYDLDCSKEIAVRIAKTMANLKALDKIWKSKAITLKTKLSILKTCVFSTMLYGCKTWTVTKRCESRILSFERKCYREILRIGWTQKVTNEELYRKIQLTKTLLQKVIQRKLGLFGHIWKMNDSRKIKTLVFGMMDGLNRRGRPHREWSDDIKQWCGATLQDSLR